MMEALIVSSSAQKHIIDRLNIFRKSLDHIGVIRNRIRMVYISTNDRLPTNGFPISIVQNRSQSGPMVRCH
jgi:coenzyme F420-reducing hydrogenase delta subunit